MLQSCCQEPFSSPFTSETRLFLLSMSRKRETRRVFLTPRLNLQFYYIPVVTGQRSAPTAAVSPVLQLPGAAVLSGAGTGGCQDSHRRTPGS